MRDVVYAVEERGWLPTVIREGDQLQLVMGIDVNRGYDIREFQFPITEQHLDVPRASLSRHLILWCMLAPLAEKAGTGDRHGVDRGGSPVPGTGESTVGVALRKAPPELLDEPIRAVASLLRDEAPARDFSKKMMPALSDVARDLRLHLYDAVELALIAEVTPDAGARPLVQHVGGELFVGVERRIFFGNYASVTQDDGLLWEAQQRVTFGQLIAAGIAKADIGRHVARDGTCWITFADLAAAVLVDPETRATIIDPTRLPNRPECRTLVPDGDLVAAPLSRLRFVMTGSDDENGMLAILEAAREAIQWGRDHISPRPLVWRHGRWLSFDWGRESSSAGLGIRFGRMRVRRSVGGFL